MNLHSLWGNLGDVIILATDFSFGDPSAAQVLGRDAGQVGFEIEDRSPVKHVEAADPQGIAFATEEFDDGESDRVGTPRRASGEDPVRAIVKRRSAE